MPDRQSPDRLVRLIGIGVGHPDHITHEAAAALHDTDVVFTVDKGEAKRGLNELRDLICRRHGGPGLRTVEVHEPERDRAPADYAAEVTRWHGARGAVWEQALREHLPPGGRGAFLVWGDPSLYDSTLRILDGVASRVAVSIEVVPGITSIQVLAARHRIPLNTVGGAVHVTTGRRLGEDAATQDTLVVMLDGASAWAQLDGDAWDIWWGAHLGGADEILVSGRLGEVAARIDAAKREARARVGWVMDVYLLRRRCARATAP